MKGFSRGVMGLAFLLAAGVMNAQNADPTVSFHETSPVAQAAKAKWEYGAFFQGGVGLEDRTNFTFLSAGGQVGRILTSEFGTGLLKGNFEYAVQLVPYWQSFTPKFPVLKCPAGATVAAQCYGPVTAGGTYHGASIEPIILRYNFTHGKKIMPWIQAAGGVVYTTRKYPAVGDLNVGDPTQTGPAADTSVWNFTPQGGVGAHYFLKPGQSMDFSANGVHISSASLGDKNPGVNVSLQLSVGYTWWK
jgi:lipid A 3-O-deacylase